MAVAKFGPEVLLLVHTTGQCTYQRFYVILSAQGEVTALPSGLLAVVLQTYIFIFPLTPHECRVLFATAVCLATCYSGGSMLRHDEEHLEAEICNGPWCFRVL